MFHQVAHLTTDNHLKFLNFVLNHQRNMFAFRERTHYFTHPIMPGEIQ